MKVVTHTRSYFFLRPTKHVFKTYIGIGIRCFVECLNGVDLSGGVALAFWRQLFNSGVDREQSVLHLTNAGSEFVDVFYKSLLARC